jgi:hypothetical protein
MGAGITFIVIAILFATLGIAAAISRRRPAVTRRALPLRPRPHRVPLLTAHPRFPQHAGSFSAGAARRGFYSLRVAHRWLR